MAQHFSIDTSELHTLALDLTKASARVQGQVVPLVFKGAMAIKAQMQAEMAASPHFKGTRPITFDIKDTPTAVSAEIGPESGPGSLANIAYFGGARGGGTVADPVGALNAEAPKVESAILALMGKVLG
jgi:hypothetical protein